MFFKIFHRPSDIRHSLGDTDDSRGGNYCDNAPDCPVSEYFTPTVQVSATYPGADARTVAEAVGEPIEQSVNGVEGMMYMSSNSGSDGSYNLRITFRNGVNLDDAAVKVQNLVSQATPSSRPPLPSKG